MNSPTFDINSFRDLEVYHLSFRLQQSLFETSKHWPREEMYSLTDQLRRSSRSVGGNVAECWAKRRYPAHFLSKLTDADGELQETHHWLLTARDCDYLPLSDFSNFEQTLVRVGKMLGSMIAKHEKFCVRR